MYYAVCLQPKNSVYLFVLCFFVSGETPSV